MSEPRQFRVLNVDDYHIGLYAKSRVLRQAGFAVTEATTGQEALEQVRVHTPDLILLDVQLPDMSGIEVARQLKANPRTAAILVLQISATFKEESYRVHALDAGADSYLVEPVQPQELVANVRALLRLRVAEETARAAAAEAELRRREAETFAELAGAINASLDLEPTLHAIVRAARALCRCDFVWLAVRGRDTARMEIRYRADDHLTPYGTPHAIEGEDGLGGQVMRTGRPVRVEPDAPGALAAGADGALARAEGVGAAVAVPVVVYGRVEGLLYALNRGPRRLADGDEVTLGRIAHHAAIAIRNSQLYAGEQAARAEAEAANRSKDQFLAVLSHELRTPLQPIIGWVHVIRESGMDPAMVTQALEVIERNARAQAQLVDDLLDVSRIISGKLRIDVRPMNLARVARSAIDVVQPAADAKQLRLISDLDEPAGAIMGDADRLQQVVWNLVSNAVKFTPQGGRVHVRLRRIGGYAELSVEDTGQGIAPAFLPFVFDRFRQADSSTTRESTGLGLGLAIVRHLVELHGGTVSARSAGADRGSTFAVRLPLVAGTDADRGVAPLLDADGATDAGALPSIAGVRVLVVDDQRDGRDLMQAMLVRAGAVVEAVGSAAEALSALDRFRPDVLLSDLEMPGVDGYTLIREIRARTPEHGGQTPAAALTAHARREERTRALAAGYQTHIAKPATGAEVLAAVAALTGRAGR